MAGCTQIQGSLVIQGTDIVTVGGLSNLTSVGDSVVLQNNPALEVVSGLDNLAMIGGGLAPSVIW